MKARGGDEGTRGRRRLEGAMKVQGQVSCSNQFKSTEACLARPSPTALPRLPRALRASARAACTGDACMSLSQSCLECTNLCLQGWGHGVSQSLPAGWGMVHGGGATPPACMGGVQHQGLPPAQPGAPPRLLATRSCGRALLATQTGPHRRLRFGGGIEILCSDQPGLGQGG